MYDCRPSFDAEARGRNCAGGSLSTRSRGDAEKNAEKKKRRIKSKPEGAEEAENREKARAWRLSRPHCASLHHLRCLCALRFLTCFFFSAFFSAPPRQIDGFQFGEELQHRSQVPAGVRGLAFAMVSGVPAATTWPPRAPPSGPRSITQSAALITSRLCSMTIRLPPFSISRSKGGQQLGDVVEVQAGGGLVEDEQRALATGHAPGAPPVSRAALRRPRAWWRIVPAADSPAPRRPAPSACAPAAGWRGRTSMASRTVSCSTSWMLSPL